MDIQILELLYVRGPRGQYFHDISFVWIHEELEGLGEPKLELWAGCSGIYRLLLGLRHGLGLTRSLDSLNSRYMKFMKFAC